MAAKSKSKKKDGGSGWFRSLFKSNIFVIVVLISGPVALAGAWFSMKTTINTSDAKTYYYDTQNGQLFTQPAFKLPPIAAPSDAQGSGQSGMLAYVYSCTACEDETARKVGWLESYDPKSITRVKGSGNLQDEMVVTMIEETDSKGLLVRATADGSPWVVRDSKEGKALMAKAKATCPNTNDFKKCAP